MADQKEIGWVVQQNLSSDRYVYDGFKKIFEKHNIPHDFVDVIPFSTDLPLFNRNRLNIFYGSTTMMSNVYADKELQPGLFFDHTTFLMDNYFQKWGERMLNYGSQITTFGKVKKLENIFKPEDDVFIRPIDDSKSFNGQIMTLTELYNWKTRVGVQNYASVTEDTELIVGTPYKINKEWRNIIVNGKVVTSSRYMKDQRLNKSAEDVPEDMVLFCEEMCKIYTPHDIFVMDIAETGGEYYIIECGCINSAGYYEADLEKIVLAIMNYVKTNVWKYQGI